MPVDPKKPVSNPATKAEFLLGEKIGLFPVIPVQEAVTPLPKHAVLIGSSPADLPVLQARYLQLQKEEREAGVTVGVALVLAKLLSVAGLSAFAVKNKQSHGIPYEVYAPGTPIADIMAGKATPIDRGTYIGINPSGVATTVGTGVAGFGVLGTAVVYIKSNSALDAQEQLIEKLIAENLALELKTQALQIVFNVVDRPSNIDSIQESVVIESQDPVHDAAHTARLIMPKMWARDP